MGVLFQLEGINKDRYSVQVSENFLIRLFRMTPPNLVLIKDALYLGVST